MTALALGLVFIATPSFAFADEPAGWDAVNAENGHAYFESFRPPFRGRTFVCGARNVSGRTFRAMGRGNARMVQMRALQSCRRGSLPIIRGTCRATGCVRR